MGRTEDAMAKQHRVSIAVPADGTAIDLEVIRLGMDGVGGRGPCRLT